MRKTRPTPPELDRLELAVRRLIESHDELARRAASAEARVRDLESALQDMAAGRLDPVALAETVDVLEKRNERLQDRLRRAREAVERMNSRLQFTTEER